MRRNAARKDSLYNLEAEMGGTASKVERCARRAFRGWTFAIYEGLDDTRGKKRSAPIDSIHSGHHGFFFRGDSRKLLRPLCKRKIALLLEHHASKRRLLLFIRIGVSMDDEHT